MSLKILILPISKEYRSALIGYLLDNPRDTQQDFYKHLNVISGYCQSVEVSLSLGGGIGGTKTVDELLASATDPFQKATYTEFLRFSKEGYSGGDFQHIFMDAYLSAMTDILCAQRN